MPTVGLVKTCLEAHLRVFDARKWNIKLSWGGFADRLHTCDSVLRTQGASIANVQLGWSLDGWEKNKELILNDRVQKCLTNKLKKGPETLRHGHAKHGFCETQPSGHPCSSGEHTHLGMSTELYSV